MKKIICILLSVLMLLSFASCGKPTTESTEPSSIISEPSPEIKATPSPLPKIPEESVEILNLAEYTIVYPQDYSAWQMKEIYILRNVIKHITGKEIDIIPDSAPQREKEIIFAGANRSTLLDEHINALESRLDYIIAVADNDIILGGLDYFGGMKAAYDFINNYLGYDDIEDVYSAPKDKITGVNKYIYEEPNFTIMCGNFYKTPYTDIRFIKDVFDAHFNLFMIGNNQYDEESFQNVMNWCVRYNLRVILPVKVDESACTFELPFYDIYEDYPNIWGHYLRDEPMIRVMDVYSAIADQYKEKYSEKGWKALVNHLGNHTPAQLYINETNGLFDSVDVVAFDYYFAMGNRDYHENELNVRPDDSILHIWEIFHDTAVQKDQEFWSYIMAFYLDDYNTSKMLRWSSYISMCFGVDAILYFNYQTWVVDNKFNKLEHWYNAEKANAEIAFVGETLCDNYNYVGTYTINKSANDHFIYLEDFYCGFDDVITDFVIPQNSMTPYLVGCYDEKDGDGNAFLLVNMEELDYVPYDETTAEPIKIKINGENVKFYREGELKEVEKDADGYYILEVGNGHCWFVTVD